MTESDKRQTQHLWLIKALKAHLAELQNRVGDQWEPLRAQFESLLDELVQARDDQISLYITRLIAAGLKTPAAGLIKALLKQTGADGSDLIDERTRSIVIQDPDSGQTRELSIDVEAPTADSVRAEARALKEALEETPVESPRYGNLFFTDADSPEPLSEDRPLIREKTYELHVHIGPEHKGLPQDDAPFPDRALADQWEDQQTLPITVMVASRDFLLSKRLDTLQLPRHGRSSEVIFPVTPKLLQGRGFLQVSLLYRGHLLQSKRIEALIVAGAGAPMPATQRPAQRALTTFTTTETLDRQTLQRFPERVLTINVEKDARDGSLDLHFIDRTRGAHIACYDTQLGSAALKEAIDSLRNVQKVMVAGRPDAPTSPAIEGYGWILEGSPALLDDWLPRLAEAGRGLYRAFLPREHRSRPGEDTGERLDALLEPDTVIQINPVLGKATLPWSLLYERPLKYIPGRTRVCPERNAHGLECAGCPRADDPYTVCPNAFWGYRYAIEQLPCWATPELPHPGPLIQRIDNDSPLALNFNVYNGFRFWRDHIAKLQQAGRINLLQAELILELDTIWGDKGAELDLVYFYVHGGLDELNRKPYLELSDGRITSNFLEASKLSWPRNPLVFLNGCETGDYGPQSYVSLIEDFRKAGACGVVGTECPVPESFAAAYAGAVLPRLFRGERIGQAMLAVRRQFIDDKLNPLGLLYALFASSEIALTTPVATPVAVEGGT